MEPLRVALIVDGDTVARWQHDALVACGDRIEVVVVIACTNTRTRKRPFRHSVYYLINLLMMRGPWRTAVPLPANAAGAPVIEFDSDYEGAWQRIPDHIVAALREHRAEAAVKFGMNLLADPEGLGLTHGVLSFHHGDPDHYRGRPAGFYEILDRAPYQGIVVQRLSKTLDGGAVLAKAKSKMHLHSYRKTLAAAYANSIPLLARAINNARAGLVQPAGQGRVYLLPSNARSLAFLATLCYRALRRIAYGGLVEKRWRVAYGAAPAGLTQPGDTMTLDPVDAPAVDARYTFYADPFPFGDDLIVEALNRRTGFGEIVVLQAGAAPRRVCHGGRHYSYPSVVVDGDQRYLLPEVALSSSPVLLRLDDAGAVVQEVALQGLDGTPVVDPTYVLHEGVHYLFGGRLGSEIDNLYCFVSEDSIRGPYRPHPQNPIVTDPGVARMAGAFMQSDGRLLRPGQNNAYQYGDGVTLMEVTELSPQVYREQPLRTFRVRGAAGPHTLNRHGDRLVFDYYRDRFSPSAGLRRLLALRTK